jgi:hypothetical protein
MLRFKLAFFAVAILSATNLVAHTYYVGTCMSGSYSTIQAAVTNVPAGSTIEICPGTYVEQIIISKALTLEALAGSGTGPVVISDVGVSLTTTTSIYWGTVAPQIQVTAGPVNITNINVFENNPSACPATEIAIFYGSGSWGTVKGVLTNGNCNFGSVGVAAENGPGASTSITIEESQINAGSNAGISVGSDQTPSTLTAEVRNNFLWTNPVAIMSLGNAQVSINNNSITSVPSGGTGVWAGSANVAVSGNRIDEQNIGIDVEGTGVSVTSNQIFNTATTGINIGVGDVIVKGNAIAYSLGSAIQFNCTGGDTVTGNMINNANIGLADVPARFTGYNTFYNVGTISTGGCS